MSYGLESAFAPFLRELADPNSDISKFKKAKAKQDFKWFCEDNEYAQNLVKELAMMETTRAILAFQLALKGNCHKRQCDCDDVDTGKCSTCWVLFAKKRVAEQARTANNPAGV